MPRPGIQPGPPVSKSNTQPHHHKSQLVQQGRTSVDKLRSTTYSPSILDSSQNLSLSFNEPVWLILEAFHTFPHFFRDSSHMHLYHMTTSTNRNSSRYHETEQPCAQGQNQNTKRNSVFLSKQACIYCIPSED